MIENQAVQKLDNPFGKWHLLVWDIPLAIGMGLSSNTWQFALLSFSISVLTQTFYYESNKEKYPELGNSYSLRVKWPLRIMLGICVLFASSMVERPIGMQPEGVSFGLTIIIFCVIGFDVFLRNFYACTKGKMIDTRSYFLCALICLFFALVLTQSFHQ